MRFKHKITSEHSKFTQGVKKIGKFILQFSQKQAVVNIKCSIINVNKA